MDRYKKQAGDSRVDMGQKADLQRPDKGRFFRIRKALEKDGIKYEVAIQNLEYTKLLTLRLLVGNLGKEEPDYKYWFYIHVHKKDQERAEYWVRRTP